MKVWYVPLVPHYNFDFGKEEKSIFLYKFTEHHRMTKIQWKNTSFHKIYTMCLDGFLTVIAKTWKLDGKKRALKNIPYQNTHKNWQCKPNENPTNMTNVKRSEPQSETKNQTPEQREQAHWRSNRAEKNITLHSGNHSYWATFSASHKHKWPCFSAVQFPRHMLTFFTQV